ncbi:MAG: 50S ribosomal protein L32 [Myxococcota bacterium]
MAVPKKRKSKMKTRSRRAANKNLSRPKIQRCPNCFAPRRPHRACGECGYYGGEQVLEVWEY